VAASPHRNDLDEQQFIEKHIDLNFDRYPYGRADAWLRDSRVSIWAIVTYLNIWSLDKIGA
jgi:hypothetical protein